jgi:hypothetical protein
LAEKGSGRRFQEAPASFPIADIASIEIYLCPKEFVPLKERVHLDTERYRVEGEKSFIVSRAKFNISIYNVPAVIFSPLKEIEPGPPCVVNIQF